MKKRILVAEDEPTNLAILSAYLENAGHTVVGVEDGKQAWEKLAAGENFDLLVTDKRMPHMDGITLALKMKSDKKLREIPVIMQTSATSQEDILEGVKAGVFYYLGKPYEESTLNAIVRSALQEGERKKIFDKKLETQRDGVGTLTRGEFELRTPEEAESIAFLLGSAFPRPELSVSGLYELLLNAVEHGNLGIGYDEKANLLANGTWAQEIKKRLGANENMNKKAIVRFHQDANKIEVTITDMGTGFDWRPFMEIEPSRATQSSGRGIAKANLLSFDRLTYQGSGNEVRVEASKK